MKVSVKNVDKVIKQLDDYKRRVLMDHFSARVREFCEEVQRVAGSLYGGAVSVSVEQLERTETTVAYLVTANGEGVVFLEFGAGDATGAGVSSEWKAKMEAEGIRIVPASYSMNNPTGGEYARTSKNGTKSGFWHFGGQVYTEVFPRRALYQAVMNAIATWRDKQ